MQDPLLLYEKNYQILVEYSSPHISWKIFTEAVSFM